MVLKRTEILVLSPMRTYVVEGPGSAVAPIAGVGAHSGVVFLALETSSSSSGFISVNGTLVDFPFG